MAVAGFIASITGAALIGTEFLVVLLSYIVISNLYSTVLKRVHTVDILTLAGLYTIRIIAGGVAAGLLVPASPWLLAFSMFFFLSLACVKRATEIAAKAQAGSDCKAISGRGYTTADEDLIKQLGISCAALSSLVLALYVSGSEVQELYSNPHFLWLSCPIVLFWLVRVWAVTVRGEMHDDPLVFAFKDRGSYFVAGLLGVLLLLAI
jgi:4-hydroxybenzoate polyprenyltransferase